MENPHPRRTASLGEEITGLLTAWRQGDEKARDQLFDRIYPHLRQVAAHQLRRRSDSSLQVTDLVNSFYVRLVGRDLPAWQNRAHFLSIAALAMREILVDLARRRATHKRGGGLTIVSLEAVEIAPSMERPDLLVLHDALLQLAETNPSAVKVVELRLFGGLTYEEIATVLEIGSATAVRRWRFARAWLRRRFVSDD